MFSVNSAISGKTCTMAQTDPYKQMPSLPRKENDDCTLCRVHFPLKIHASYVYQKSQNMWILKEQEKHPKGNTLLVETNSTFLGKRL